MYALHFYAATHEDDLRRALSAAVAGGLPVFVTEFGICEASSAGEIDYAWRIYGVRLMNELDVGYTGTCRIKDERQPCSSPAQKTSGFTLDDLTEEGPNKPTPLKNSAREGGGTGGRGERTTTPELDARLCRRHPAVDLQGGRPLGGGRPHLIPLRDGRLNYSAGVKSWSVMVPFDGEVTLEDRGTARLGLRHAAHCRQRRPGRTVPPVLCAT